MTITFRKGDKVKFKETFKAASWYDEKVRTIVGIEGEDLVLWPGTDEDGGQESVISYVYLEHSNPRQKEIDKLEKFYDETV